MPKLKQRRSVIEKRRELVAMLRLRGLTIRGIVEALPAPPFNSVNTATGRPWSRGKIHDDLMHLEAEWRKNAAGAIADRQALLLAEIGALKRQGWATNDLPLVLHAIDREMKMFGIGAPAQLQISGPGGGPIQGGKTVFYIPHNGRDLLDMTDEQLLARLREAEGSTAPTEGAGEADAETVFDAPPG